VVTTANQRSALAALDLARPIIARLDVARHPEDVAADLIEGWSAVETALRSLMGGSSLSGQALIRELRQRQLLTFEQANALAEFQAARDRAQRTQYRPSSADVEAARAGFQQLEAGLLAAEAPGAPSAPDVAPVVTAAPTYDTMPAGREGRGMSAGLAILLGLVVLAVVAGAAWYAVARTGSAGALERGVEYYRAGKLAAAREEFVKAAREDQGRAASHIYLGRIARDEGNIVEARAQLDTAVRLEPANALALRELGSLMFTTGNYELARRFYVRALQQDGTDRNAMGYLGCSLARLGRVDEGQRFLTRAGPGPWSACASAAGPAVPPGAVSPGVAPRAP
jgi:tetratricopeptide (TPR) repeat protein